MELVNEVFESENFIEALKKLYKQDTLSPKTAFRLNLVYKEIETMNLAYLEVKEQIVQKYSTKNEKGDYVVSGSDKVQEFNSKMNELLEIPFEIKYDLIPYDEAMTLSASDMSVLGDIIDFSTLME